MTPLKSPFFQMITSTLLQTLTQRMKSPKEMSPFVQDLDSMCAEDWSYFLAYGDEEFCLHSLTCPHESTDAV